jgi:hypothetical protein
MLHAHFFKCNCFSILYSLGKYPPPFQWYTDLACLETEHQHWYIKHNSIMVQGLLWNVDTQVVTKFCASVAPKWSIPRSLYIASTLHSFQNIIARQYSKLHFLKIRSSINHLHTPMPRIPPTPLKLFYEFCTSLISSTSSMHSTFLSLVILMITQDIQHNI